LRSALRHRELESEVRAAVNTDQFTLNRLGVIMEPSRGQKEEAWGVLNPASARTADGRLLLFPRAVAEGNYSRIERVEVVWADGAPAGVERQGFALEPEAPYEHDLRSQAGVEDPRVTFVRPLDRYVMAYVALGRVGPRVALAISGDAISWQRLGLLRFRTEVGVDFSEYGNKDAMFFPQPVSGPGGKPALAILHRPTYLIAHRDGTVERRIPPGVEDARGSIWISYVDLAEASADPGNLTRTYHSCLLATPEYEWEALKIGGGVPPILCEAGWVFFYHGVAGKENIGGGNQKDVCYQAGVMLLDRDDPRRVIFRSPDPVLSPAHQTEQQGAVPDVVFPTAVDVDGQRLWVFYGAADSRIAVATTMLETEVLLAPSAP